MLARTNHASCHAIVSTRHDQHHQLQLVEVGAEAGCICKHCLDSYLYDKGASRSASTYANTKHNSMPESNL